MGNIKSLFYYQELKLIELGLIQREGIVAPWFDEPGLGPQYLTDLTIDELEKGEYVLKIK